MLDIYRHLQQITSTRGWPEWSGFFPHTLPPAEAKPSLWTDLQQKTNPALWVPKPAEGVEAHPLEERGQKLWVLKHRATNTYLRVSAEDHFVWTQIDGQRTIVKLSIAYAMKYNSMALGRIQHLVELLQDKGLVTGGVVDKVYGPLQNKLAAAGVVGKLRQGFGWLMNTFLFRQFPVDGIGGAVNAAYKWGVWLLYTRVAVVLMGVLGAIGLGVFLNAGGLIAPNGARSVPEIVALVVLVLVALFLHECGHAFTVRRFGREVNRGGLIMMYGMPGAYIDTSDMWLASKPARLAVTAAGPFVNFVLGGLAALAMLIWPERAAFFSFFAFTNYLFIVANAIPFLKFDGYYLLMDWLEIPNLLERATGFFQRELWPLLRRSWAAGEWWPKFTREQWIFVFFGGISTLWMINLLYLPLLVMPARVFGLLGQVLTTDLRTVAGLGLLGSLALALFFGLLQANMFSANVRQQVQQLARTIQNRPGWQSALIILAVALVLGFLPEEMRLQTSLASSAGFWAQALPIVLPLLAAGFSASLALSMAGSPWRWWYSGLALSSAALTSYSLLSTFSITNSLILLISFIFLCLAFTLSARLWRFAVRGDLGGVLLLIVLSALMWPVSGDWAWRVALALWCGAAFLAWHLIRRPLLPPARLVDMMPTEDADPAQHTPHLTRAFSWLLRTTLQQTVEVSGPASRAKLVEAFNGVAVDNGWPLWFNAHGLLTDQVTAPFNERAQIYRSALAGWLALLGEETETRFAADTLAQAYFDLPLRLRRLAANHVLNELPWDGLAPWARSEQGGDRLKLRLAFRHLAEGPMLACARVYGRPLAEQLMGEFNQVAALAEWGLWFRANGRLADEAQGDVLALGEIFQSALADVLGRMAYYTGARFVEASLLQTHDALPWQLREVAAPTLLRALPWASRLKLGEAESVVELLQKQPAFSALPVETLAQLAQSARLIQAPAGRRLHMAGQTLRWASLIRTGRVEVLAAANGTRRVEAVLNAGAVLELEALTTGQAAQAEARTVTAVELLQLPAEAARRALAEAPSRPEAALLSRIPLFRELAPDELRRLSLCLRPRTLPAGEVVVRRGESDRDLYVIGGGELAVMVEDATPERVVAHLGPGEFFGEMALLRGEPRSATVRALTEAQVWTLSADDYAEFMREAPALRAALEQMGSRRHLELRAA